MYPSLINWGKIMEDIFILFRAFSYCETEWEYIGKFYGEQEAINTMQNRLDKDWEDAFSGKWECFAIIQDNRVINSDTKNIWSEFKIVKIQLPDLEGKISVGFGAKVTNDSEDVWINEEEAKASW